MQLHVRMSSWGVDALDIDQVVHSFDDLDKIAAQVGRAVRKFLREVPVRKQRSRNVFDVTATWTEAAERAERKKKRGKKAAAEEANG